MKRLYSIAEIIAFKAEYGNGCKLRWDERDIPRKKRGAKNYWMAIGDNIHRFEYRTENTYYHTVINKTEYFANLKKG